MANTAVLRCASQKVFSFLTGAVTTRIPPISRARVRIVPMQIRCSRFWGLECRILIRFFSKGLQLSYRRGYYADSADFSSKSTDRADADPLLPLLGFGMPNFDQILFKMQLNVAMARVADGQKTAGSNTEMKGPLTRYRADFAILPQDLQFDKTADGRRLGHLEVMLVAYDADGKIVNILKRDLPVSLTEDVFQTAQRGGLQIREEIDVPAGDVYLRMGIYDMNTGKCGSIGVPLQTKGQSGGGK